MMDKRKTKKNPTTTRDPLAGKSKAFKAALEAVESMGQATAQGPAETGRNEHRGRTTDVRRGRGARREGGDKTRHAE